MKTTTYKIPGRFFEDHLNRFYGEGAWESHDRQTEKWSGRYVTVALTDDQFSELLSDAEFYAEGGGGFDPEYRGLMRSAEATVRALTREVKA
jgi:hypothetical protein